MKSLVFCCVIVNCFVLGLCDVPQCFKLKFGEIACNQDVDVNTVIKTVPAQNECLSMAKGLEVFAKVGKMIGNKFEQLYNEEKQKNAILNNQISDITKKMNTAIAKCVGYKYQATPNKGTFEASRKECKDMGGDLIQDNIGPDGAQYHKEIRQLAIKYTAAKGHVCMWVGYRNAGNWRFLNGKSYDAHNRGQEAVAYWGPGEPNNYIVQNCGKLWRKLGPLQLDNEICNGNGNWTKCHGLCEIKINKCST